MDYLTIGQLSIPIAWLAFIFAILYSDFRNKGADSYTNKTIEQLVWVYLAIWKLSYVLFSWTDFLKAPLSILYFDGGMKGHVIGLLALAIVFYKKRAVLDWQSLWRYWARFVAVYHIISNGFGEQWLIVVLWVGVWLFIERKFHISVLFVEWLLLVWLGGWSDEFVHVHGIVFVTLLSITKQFSQIATIGILSLVAFMLTDIQQPASSTIRVAIDLPTTTGEHYRLSEQDQPFTVVNFFATWCPPCQAEMPHLQSFAEDLPADVKIIGVNLTARDDGQEALMQFMATYDVTYPILLDETDDVGTAFQVMSIPTTVLLNAEGQEVDRIVGPISEHALRKLVEQYK